MSSVPIRAAETRDLNKMCEFAEELLHKWDARTTAEDARRVYEQILATPELGVILVAENDGRVCGFAYASYQWRSEYGGETLGLVEMFVEHSSRNRGVGHELLQGLVGLAR